MTTEAPKTKRAYHTLATHSKDRIPDKLDRLAKIITRERGVRIYRADVLAIVVNEALAARTKKPETPSA